MTFDEWESKTIAFAGESPNAYARRAFNAALKSAAGASEGHTIGGVPVDHSDDVTITREHYEDLLRQSAELTALRERVAGIRLEALLEARHVAYMALSLNDAFKSIDALVDKEKA